MVVEIGDDKLSGKGKLVGIGRECGERVSGYDFESLERLHPSL